MEKGITFPKVLVIPPGGGSREVVVVDEDVVEDVDEVVVEVVVDVVVELCVQGVADGELGGTVAFRKKIDRDLVPLTGSVTVSAYGRAGSAILLKEKTCWAKGATFWTNFVATAAATSSSAGVVLGPRDTSSKVSPAV